MITDHTQAYEKEMQTALVSYEKKGNPDKAILLVNQT